jgi:Tol biopolymer transport system component
MTFRSQVPALLVIATAFVGCSDGPLTPAARVASVQVLPATATVAVLGRTTTFSAQATDANGAVVAGVQPTWSSSTTSVATVDGTGLVTAVGPGQAQIMARMGAITGSALITVSQVPWVVEIGASVDTLRALGAQITLAAVVRDSGAAPIAGSTTTWTSSDTTVLTVTAAGIATAVAEGGATVTAATGGVSAIRYIAVHQAVRSLSIVPAADTARAFGPLAARVATALDSLGRVVAGRPVEWESSDPAVVSIDGSGVPTVHANGTATISATVDGLTATLELVVDVRGIVRIRVAVSGDGEDADGFDVLIGSDVIRTPGNETIIVADLEPAPLALSVGDLDAHCFGLYDRASIVVVAGETRDVTFRIRCNGNYAYEHWTPGGTELHFVDRFDNGFLIASGIAEHWWAWSPDGSRIAFSMQVDDNIDLYVANPDGTGRIRLTNHPDADTRPSWSPDGQRIAFRSDPLNGYGTFYIVRTDGSALDELLRLADDTDTGPVWSPAGDVIAYSRLSNDRSSIDIWTIAPDGSGSSRLETADRWSYQPTWSPDGSWLAFSAAIDAGPWTLRVIRPNGTGERTLATSEQGGVWPRWAPDGQALTFHKYGEDRYQVARVNFDGTQETQLTPWYQAAFDGEWTADGEHILFTALQVNLPWIVTMSADGSARQVLHSSGGERNPRARPR